MIKNAYSRTATCPCCGRTINYHTRSEKRAFSSFGRGSGGDYDADGYSGCAKILGIGAFIVIGLPLILLSLIFGEGFWPFLGEVISLIFDILSTVIEFIFEGIWWIVSDIFDLFF